MLNPERQLAQASEASLSAKPLHAPFSAIFEFGASI
jgi:hypothetical protein